MAYQLLDVAGINQASGLRVDMSVYAERLERALNNQTKDRGMELVAIVQSSGDGPLYIFKHGTG